MYVKDPTSKMREITHYQISMLDKAEKRNRPFSDEEEKEYRRLEHEYEVLSSMVTDQEAIGPQLDSDYKRMGKDRGNNMKRNFDADDPEYRDYCNAVMSGKTENRTLQAQLDQYGGFLVVPEVVASEVLTSLNNSVFIRPLATSYMAKAASYGIPTMDDDVSDPSFTGEITELQLDTAMDFEKRVLRPKRLCKGIKWSRTLASIGAVGVVDFINSRLTYKLSVVEEYQFLQGNGANAPLGMFVESSDGIPATRNVSEGSTTTSLTGDSFINCLYNLRDAYVRDPSCRWILHRNVLKQAKKLKTGTGEYVFDFDVAGIPRILGIPVISSEYAPSTMTSGLRVGMVGALRFYGIASHEEFKIQTLTELYALQNCNATLIEEWIDGMPLLSEAFSALTLA
jgi:HK97 family phage major capsid protein